MDCIASRCSVSVGTLLSIQPCQQGSKLPRASERLPSSSLCKLVDDRRQFAVVVAHPARRVDSWHAALVAKCVGERVLYWQDYALGVRQIGRPVTVH